MDKKYRVWWIINVPGKPVFTYVNTPEEGYKIASVEVQRQLKDPNIISNAFGLEVYEDGAWSDWYDEDGNGFFEHFEQV